MEAPIQIMPSTIKHEKRWACVKTGIACFLLGVAFDIIIGDTRIMNKAIIEHVREVTVIEQSHPMNIFDTKGKWISQGDPVALTPEKENN